MKRRILIRWTIPFVVVELLQLVIFPQWNVYILCAWLGFVVGASIHYPFGRRDEERLIDEIYGENWREGAIKQQLEERRQKAPLN